MAEISVDEWMDRYLAGEWVPGAVVQAEPVLLKCMSRFVAIWSVATDSFRIESAFRSGEVWRVALDAAWGDA